MVENRDKKLYKGIFLRRYKRFFADFQMEDGSKITAHCPNPGRMTSCMNEGWESILSLSGNPNRKLPYTWEMIHNGKTWIGVNTVRANEIVHEALLKKQIPELALYTEIKREYKVDDSRIDFLLLNPQTSEVCYLEVKSVTYLEKGVYFFPDAVTARGKKHLETLSSLIASDTRGVIFFLVQRSDGKELRMARHIDPAYASAMDEAVQKGVEVMAWECSMKPDKIKLKKTLPVPEYSQ
ncbi:MAG: DNA/RNA nuclease SfsA [Spirochaetia bacterium]|nr:DNA/RNA nuclease SfsA [Spirochaetia bacterium]